MATLNVATDFYALQNCSPARFFSLPYQILGKCLPPTAHRPPPPLGCSTKNVKAWRPALVLASLSKSRQVFYKLKMSTSKKVEIKLDFQRMFWAHFYSLTNKAFDCDLVRHTALFLPEAGLADQIRKGLREKGLRAFWGVQQRNKLSQVKRLS